MKANYLEDFLEAKKEKLLRCELREKSELNQVDSRDRRCNLRQQSNEAKGRRENASNNRQSKYHPLTKISWQEILMLTVEKRHAMS